MLEASAKAHLEDIYVYTLATWGSDQADAYLSELTETFQDISDGRVRGRAVDLSSRIRGFVCRCRSHYIYWRVRGDGRIGIVAVLHARMQQSERLQRAWPDDLA